MNSQPGEQGSQTEHSGNPEDGGGSHRGEQHHDDAATSDAQTEGCQQHEGPQGVETGDAQGEGRGEEGQHGARLLGTQATPRRPRHDAAGQARFHFDSQSVLPSPSWVRQTDPMREWRNGRRAGFRCQCPLGRGGSTPLSRTAIKWSVTR